MGVGYPNNRISVIRFLGCAIIVYLLLKVHKKWPKRRKILFKLNSNTHYSMALPKPVNRLHHYSLLKYILLTYVVYVFVYFSNITLLGNAVVVVQVALCKLYWVSNAIYSERIILFVVYCSRGGEIEFQCCTMGQIQTKNAWMGSFFCKFIFSQ